MTSLNAITDQNSLETAALRPKEIHGNPRDRLLSSLTRGWIPLLILPLIVLKFTPAACPKWATMWLLCGAIYAGCKWLTWRRTPITCVPTWRQAAYLLAWPGLDAPAFLTPTAKPERLAPPLSEWAFATFKTLFGAALFWLVAREVPTEWSLMRGWIGMIGLAFLLHFGLFHLLSCFWRANGVDAKPLMDWPIASTSVSEFWGRRWNRAFRDLTHRFLFRPLTRILGPRWGLAAGFLFSGLVHELVITVPAGGGYGGPTLFFGLQAGALLAERTHAARRFGLNSLHSVTGWIFTASVMILPAALLFPPCFVREIILPFMQALTPKM